MLPISLPSPCFSLVSLVLPALLQAQNPQFTELPSRNLPVPRTLNTQRILTGDVDGNGTKDLVILDGGGQQGATRPQARLMLNDGNGKFTDGGAKRIPIGYGSIAGALADMDGDGDLDLVLDGFHSGTTAVFLFRNDGRGNFTLAQKQPFHLSKNGEFISNLSVGDLDADGDLDLITLDIKRFVGGQPKIYLNNGKGAFTAAPARNMPAAMIYIVPMVLVDVDLDKDLDLMLGQKDRVSLYLNNGRGVFTDATTARMPRHKTWFASSMIPLDIQGDGYPDLVLVDSSGKTRLYRNSKGSFQDITQTHLPQSNAPTRTLGIASADVDLDGDIDIFFSDMIEGPSRLLVAQNRLYLNNGKGAFVDATSTRLPKEKDISTYAVMADFDQDGDPDIVYSTHKYRLLFNLHRQTHATTDPVRGKTWSLGFHGQPGYATQAQTVLPLLGGIRLQPRPSIPPLGLLGLGPTSIFPLQSLRIARTGGRASLSLPIPNNPGLKDAQLHIQGLWIPGTAIATWRLGNVFSATIR